MGKKGARRKGDDDFEKDFMLDEEGDEQPKEQVEAPAAAAGKKKKDKKKGGKKGKADWDSDDDEPKLAPPPAGGSDAEEEAPPPAAVAAKKGGKKKGGGGGSAGRNGSGSLFALLQEDGEGDAEEDEEEESAPKASGSQLWPWEMQAPSLVVAEVLSVDPHPKADRLRVCTLDAGGSSPVKVVTNAPNVEEGMKVVFAPVGATTPGSGIKIERASLRGVDSFGMLCSAHDAGWVSEPDGVLVELPEDAEVGEPCPQKPPTGARYGAAAKPGKKDKKKEKKGRRAVEAEEEGEEIEEEEEAVVSHHAHAKDKKGKKKGGKKDMGSLFAALAEEEEEEEEAAAAGDDAEQQQPEEEEEEERPAAKPRDKKKKKKGGFDASSAFAALSLDGEAGEGEAAAAEAQQPDQQQQQQQQEEEEEEPIATKDKKKKKKKADFDDAFAALAGEANGEAAAPDANGEHHPEEGEDMAAALKGGKKKAKKKGGLAADLDIDALLAGETEEAPAPEAADDKKGKKGKKGKGKAAVADEDLDALLAELDGPKAPAPEPAAPAAAPEPEPAEAKKDKKGKKGKGKAAVADEDLDALLAELDGPKAPALAAQPAVPAAAAAAVEPAPAGGKSKKKKKGKGGAAKEEDEDLDTLLAELGAVPAQQVPAAAAPATEMAAAAAADEAADGEGEGDEGEGGDKEMSAAAKRKAKRKAKEKAKKAGGQTAEEAAAEEAAEEAAAAAAAAEKKGGKKGGGGGGAKVSAAVRRMQEALEAQRRAQEEAERLAEEQRRREEEEERQREEEEQRKAEEAERRRKEKAERRAQLKKEGKLLTGKAKAEAERLARAREQFLRQAGLDPDAVAVPKKKPVYDRKKKQPKKAGEQQAESEQPAATEQPDEAAAAAAAAAAPAAEAAEPMQVDDQAPQPEPAAIESPAVAEANIVESWEEAAVDDWEAMDVEEIKLPGQANGKLDEPPTPAPASEAEQPAGAAAAKAAATAAKDKVAAAAKAVAAAAAAVEAEEDARGSSEEQEEGSSEEEDESEDESEEESSDEEESGSSSEEESSSEEDSSSEEESDSEDEMEARVAAAREKRDAALQAALAHRDPKDLRSPICCILGHVDTGKTKILDNIRRTNVQDGEAGGITQQIGATYIPADALRTRTEDLRKGRQFELKLPGLLVIDTPGHESFSNLRSRGSGLCDIAILVVDLMHGLEQQTVESINLLKMRKTPFIIAMNKVDRLYDWKAVPNSPIQDSLARQPDYVRREFEDRLSQASTAARVSLALNEQGLNVALYWRNRDPNTYHSIVPTSAVTGEGIPDLLQLMVKLTQSLMVERLMFVDHLQASHSTAQRSTAGRLGLAWGGSKGPCTVLEVKQIEGLGTTIDVVLVNGQLREGDTIVVCGLGGPIVTTCRALLTPHPLRELRVKGSYLHHKTIRAAMGVKIAAHNLESAVAGTQLYVCGPDDDVEALKEEVMEDMTDIFSSVDKTGEGVCVQASTLGSLEALLEFLRSPDVGIAVSAINIGPVHKKDVMRANVMIERGMKKFGVILAFDVPVTKEARELAESMGVKIFTADIIYHLFDQFTAYLKKVKEEEQEAAKLDAVFPCVLKIMPTCVFNKKDPIVLGVEVVDGIAKIGTPLCVPTQGGIDLGRIASMEKDHKAVDTAKKGDAVAMKIEATNPTESQRLYGRHFDFKDELVSKISRKSINVLKEMFRDDMGKDDWKLVIKLKKTFRID
ncbi:hypothetical protein N2152v2_003874 [Parachlorella kessleri]